VSINIAQAALPIPVDELLARIEQFLVAGRTTQPAPSPSSSRSTAMASTAARQTTAPTAEQPVKQLRKRAEVPESDRWDLGTLYLSDDTWEADFQRWEAEIPKYAEFQARLGESAHVRAGAALARQHA
jgi:hypothetical protein